MIVSRKWLADYVPLPMPVEELTDRLTLTGLNLEGVEQKPELDDVAIDLEVTSNRPDCLGHIGVAREVSVLWGGGLKRPDPRPGAAGPDVSGVTAVAVEQPGLCPRYTARVIRGVTVGPSPGWLADRLRSIGCAVINNVVDVTNFVLFECGQPLHAFDFSRLRGGRIVVRQAARGEEFIAIDHKAYTLSGDEVVIADAERPVALGGVMGGHDCEVTAATTDLLIESACFAPLAVRGAARRHHLHSPSSYRFERGVDPEGIDWASRRCCELILELAGGELCGGVIDVAPPGHPTRPTEPMAGVALRFSQIRRLLGMSVPADRAADILTALGCTQTGRTADSVTVIPPSWRADLTREADLLEEVARIHGYDKIPADAGVRLVASSRGREEIVLERVRGVLTAAGFDEAVTLSAVDPEWVEAFRPWSDAPPLQTATSVLRTAGSLRQSLVPSLLACRQTNEKLSNPTIELFEIAKVYLPAEGRLPDERRVLALTTGGGFLEAKGVIEGLVRRLAPTATLSAEDAHLPLLDASRSCRLRLDGRPLGVLGGVAPEGLDRFDLRGATTVAEIDLAPLVAAARLAPLAGGLSSYPPVSRDLNVVVAEETRWSAIEAIVRREGRPLLEHVAFQDDAYRDAAQLGPGNKSVLFTVRLRKQDGTLTGDEADAVRDKIVAALQDELGGKLRA